MSILNQDIKYLKGVGEKRANCLLKLGIKTINDIIRFYPRGYEDFSNPVSISQAVQGEICCVKATVITPVTESMIRKGMTLYKLRVTDGTGFIDITFFNNRYIKELLLQDNEYLFYGKITDNFFNKQMNSPEFLSKNDLGLKPCYHLTEGINNRIMRDLVKKALKLFPEDITDSLPDEMRRKYKLCILRYAIFNIHFPKNAEELERAKKRLVFEELVTLQLGMLNLKDKNQKSTAAVCENNCDFAQFFNALPFELTNAQKKAITEASEDMKRSVPMSRLLQGDVGSGKTAVAAALCWFAAKNGFQSALMAPTEILAQQHYRSLTVLFEKCGIKAGLLTGSIPAREKQRIKEMLASNGLDMVVGTHAILQEGVNFNRLGLVVTDEQHRFGVGQRAMLTEKGENPHTLVMSATPIPRTLALIVYGDLDVSVLDELPAGRRQIQTYFVDSAKRNRIYTFIKKHLDNGFQAFIVCPQISDSDSGLASAESYSIKIAKEDFAGYKVGMLHGKLKPAEKEAVMYDFAQKKYHLLVSTTVIEVGVDVPNAVIMVIENAERFGLSQLHQLRGRVGRGEHQSYCILISDAQAKETVERLKIMCGTTDGFKIAEADLKLRGPGDFFGHKQHGLPELKIADIYSNMEELKLTGQAARDIAQSDPELSKAENRGLKENINMLFNNDNVIFN